MPDAYLDLLGAAIQYLEDLKDQGEHWVQVDPEVLAALSTPVATLPRIEPAKIPDPAQPVPVAPVSEPQASPSKPAGVTPLYLAEPLVAPEVKAKAASELRERVLACQKCPHLVRSRKSVVFGVGDMNSPLMFVGEAPGADEDAQGEPFVGAAGQLLTRIIKAMGFSRDTVYIANVLKCLPDTPGQSYGNRKPTADEMKTCLPYLLEQIQLIRPKVMVALGATAMEGLFGKGIAISRARGHWHDFQGTPVMPTYHPSYLLRNQAPAVKREVWEDMLQVLERLGATISDKQRNYFKS